MCLHNIRYGSPSFDLIHPCLRRYDGSDKRMIRFALVFNPSELGSIRALPKDNGLFYLQVLQVELFPVELNKRSHFLNIYLDNCFYLTEIDSVMRSKVSLMSKAANLSVASFSSCGLICGANLN